MRRELKVESRTGEAVLIWGVWARLGGLNFAIASIKNDVLREKRSKNAKKEEKRYSMLDTRKKEVQNFFWV